MLDPVTTQTATVRNARNAVFVVFAMNGFGFASWMSRIPHVRDALGLEPGELGRILLALAAGAVVALPTSGFVVSRVGAARTVTLGALLGGCGLIGSGLAVDPLTSVAGVAVGLIALGYGTGSWDVAMNVEGAAVERLLNKSIMPRFHAAFSLGTVLGAALGAGATWLEVPVSVHLAVVGVVATVATLVSTWHFLPRPTEAAETTAQLTASVLRAWREPRTLLIGVMVLCFALIEGIANDWLAVGLVDGYDVANAVGSAGFAVFVAAMTSGRLAGPWFLDRYGRRIVVRAGGVMAVLGTLVVIFSGSIAIGAVGIVLWGLGASLGFPVGMSAASDDPTRAAARVSVVSSIGYTAFLAGPPLLGWIGDHQGILQALMVATVAAALGASVAAAAEQR
jgi:fucose permease